MKLIQSKRTLRITNFAFAAMLVVSTLTAGVPFILSQKADAISSNVYGAVDLDGWTVDRTAPSGGSGIATFDGRQTLQLNVSTLASNPGTFSSYEGLQKTITPSNSIKADLYVDPSWPTSVRAGIWGGGYDANNDPSSYPIIEYNKSVASQWRIFNSDGSGWHDVTVSSATTGWNTIELTINKNDSTKTDIYVNNVYVGTSVGDPTESFKKIYVNNYNTGDANYAVRWSNFQDSSVPTDYSKVYVSTTGSDDNNGVSAAFPFKTVQKALDTVAENGTVYVADGAYTGTAVIKKNGTKLIGQSGNRDAVELHVLPNASGQGGVYADSLNDITIQSVAVVGTPEFTSNNNALIKLSNGTNATINNVVVKSADIVTPGAQPTNTSGININGYANVNIDNVFVAGLKKDGISFVGQQNGSVVTKNVRLNNIAVSGTSTSWSALAFYTKDASITGVTFQDVRLQYGDRGLYIDGSNSAGAVNKNTVNGVNGGILQLNNTLIKNVNREYINNEQTANVNASGISVDFQNRPVYVDTLAVSDLTPTELANLRTNFIKDKTNKNPTNLNYGTVFIQGPAAPTNLSPNGWTTSNVLSWTAATDAVSYNVRYSRTHYNNINDVVRTGITGTSLDDGLADGPLFWQVQSVDAAGNVGPWSNSGITSINGTTPATIDTTAPVVAINPFQVTPTNSTITLNGTVSDQYLSSYQYEVLGSGQDSATPVVVSTGTSIVNGTLATIDTTGLAEGAYTVKLSARDVVGHVTTVSSATSFTVDRTGPGIVDNGYTQNGNVFTTGYVTSADIDHITWSADPTNPTDGVTFNDQVINPAFTVTKDGTYSFILKAFDAAGNATSQLLSFTYETPTDSNSGNGTGTDAGTGTGNGATGTNGTTGTGTTLAAPATVPTAGFTGVIGATAAGQAVLGATTDNTGTANTADEAVKGVTDDKTAAAAVNSDANQGRIFGMAWYWWLLILAAAAGIAWWIIAAVRRRNEA